MEISYGPNMEMNLFYDNKAAIDISQNPIQHDWTKHMEIDIHFIKRNLEEKIFWFIFVKSEDQLADILTKAISSRIFNDSLDKLGIKDIYAPIWGGVLAWTMRSYKEIIHQLYQLSNCSCIYRLPSFQASI